MSMVVVLGVVVFGFVLAAIQARRFQARIVELEAAQEASARQAQAITTLTLKTRTCELERQEMQGRLRRAEQRFDVLDTRISRLNLRVSDYGNRAHRFETECCERWQLADNSTTELVLDGGPELLPEFAAEPEPEPFPCSAPEDAFSSSSQVSDDGIFADSSFRNQLSRAVSNPSGIRAALTAALAEIDAAQSLLVLRSQS